MPTNFEEEIMKQPFIQELSMLLGDNVVKIPYIEKNKILMSPGTWNGYFYSKEEILSGFRNTNWEERGNRNLFLDHVDNKAGEWIGEISNQMVSNEGILTGDLIIYDPVTATKLSYGKPKMGISPKVRGDSDGKAMKNFAFENFSIVINPAVKTAWINNSDGSEPVFMDDEQTLAEWDTKYVNDLPDSSFAYVEAGDKDGEGKTVPRGNRHLPYKNKEGKVDLPHLRNALARVSQTKISDNAKAQAKSKLESAAKTAGINSDNTEGVNKMAGGEENKKDEKVPMADKVEAKPETQEPKQELDKEKVGGSEIDAFVKFYGEYKGKKPEASFDEIADAFGGNKDEPKAEAEMKLPNPSKNPEEVEKMMDSKVAEMEKTIKIMSEQISELNKKLEAPDRVTSKGSAVQELGSKEDSDVSFMNYLKGSNL